MESKIVHHKGFTDERVLCGKTWYIGIKIETNRDKVTCQRCRKAFIKTDEDK